jgi:hypothetical protein
VKSYCPNCDAETEFVHKQGIMRCNGEDLFMWKCLACGSASSIKHEYPPNPRVFEQRCNHCSYSPDDIEWNDPKNRKHVITTHTWKEECMGHPGHSWFECDKCKTKVSLPNDPIDRKKLVDWQAAGCPPPWWFRPTQAIVFFTLLGLCLWQPFWFLVGYCAFTYILMGYEFTWGSLRCNDGRFFAWLLSPLWFPFFFLLCALRLPIL